MTYFINYKILQQKNLILLLLSLYNKHLVNKYLLFSNCALFHFISSLPTTVFMFLFICLPTFLIMDVLKPLQTYLNVFLNVCKYLDLTISLYAYWCLWNEIIIQADLIHGLLTTVWIFCYLFNTLLFLLSFFIITRLNYTTLSWFGMQNLVLSIIADLNYVVDFSFYYFLLR